MTGPVIVFGLMGGNMVENLQNRGNKPNFLDLKKEAVAAVVARGGLEASSAAEGTSANLQAAVDAGMGSGNVPEIFDYFLKLAR